MHVVTNNDQKILMPLLFIIYQALITNSTTFTSIASTVVKINVFGSLASIEKVANRLTKAKLSFFKRIVVPTDPFSSFTKWIDHEQWFLNVICVAQ
jgi:hypothetical protein